MSFKQTDERTISGEVKLMKWNPRMDLMAMVMKSNEVAMHRLANWQRVWSISPMYLIESKANQSSEMEEFKTKQIVKVQQIEWRPDGRVLAIAFDHSVLNLKIRLDAEIKSSVALVDVENAEFLHVIEVSGSIVTNLTWCLKVRTVEEKGQHEYCLPPHIDFIPRLKALAKSYSNKSTVSVTLKKLNEDNLADSMKVSKQEDLSILIVATDNGEVQFYALGLLKVGCIHLPGKFRVADVAFSNNLDTVLITAVTSLADDELQKCSVFIYRIDHLQGKDAQFLMVAQVYAQIIALMRYAKESILAISETWEDLLVELDSKLSHSMRKHNAMVDSATPDPNSLLSDEFMELLVFGTPSEPLDKFLQDLTVKGLKKLGTSIELTYSNIQKLIVIHLQRVAHHIFCHINTLKGICLWDLEFGDVGLDIKHVDDSMQSVGGLLMKATEIQQVIDTSVRNVKAFFRWLYTTMMKMYESQGPAAEVVRISQQDLQFVAEFIKTNFASIEDETAETDAENKVRPTNTTFTLERVGQYFQDESLTHKNSTASNPWIKYLQARPHFPRSVPETLKSRCLFPHNVETSLIQEFKNLEAVMKNTFSGVELTFENKYRKISHLPDVISLAGDRDKRNNPKAVHRTDKDNLLTVLVDGSFPSKNLYFLRIESSSSNLYGSAACFSLKANVETGGDNEEIVLSVLDFDFYNEKTITVTLVDETSAESLLAQIPVAIIAAESSLLDSSLPGFSLKAHCKSKNIVLSENTTPEVYFRKLDNFKPLFVAVSGTRKIACAVSGKRIRIFETDAVEDEEDEEMDRTDVEKEQSTLGNISVTE
ncbi:Anaphase-promoting complex subunit 4 [Halotydeus destructor]|nr:Anaphase-promoting complex subunit 4 [Halotydeus destructor]